MCRPAEPPTRTLAVLALVLATGCRSYNERTEGAFSDFQRGHFDASQAAYSDADTTGSEFLAGAEAGMVALAAGDWEAARAHFHRAAADVEELEQRALVNPEDAGRSLMSWALSDASLEYPGEGYERVYVHACLALAYLALGQIDDVYVEARLSNRLLEAEEELYEREYRAGGLGHLVSALAYELIGEPDNAYVDYLRMEEKGLGTALAGRALVRLARQLDRRDDLAAWEEKYGPDLERPEGAASIVVIAGIGNGPHKLEGSLAIPTKDGIIPFAVPLLEAGASFVQGLELALVATGEAVRTDVVEDVATVAKENLDDRLAWLALKSAGRGLLKRELTKKLEDEHGVAGRIAGDLFALATERADLRCWRTLPETWQSCRLFVPPGEHGLELRALGGERQALGTYRLDPGETMLVLARTIGGRLYAHPVGGLRLDETHPVETGEATAP